MAAVYRGSVFGHLTASLMKMDNMFLRKVGLWNRIDKVILNHKRSLDIMFTF